MKVEINFQTFFFSLTTSFFFSKDKIVLQKDWRKYKLKKLKMQFMRAGMSENVHSQANYQDSRLTVGHPHCGPGEVRVDILCSSVSTSVKLYKTYSIPSLQESKELTHSFPWMPPLSYPCNLNEAEIALRTPDGDFERGNMVKQPRFVFPFSQGKLLTGLSPTHLLHLVIFPL